MGGRASVFVGRLEVWWLRGEEGVCGDGGRREERGDGWREEVEFREAVVRMEVGEAAAGEVWLRAGVWGFCWSCG